MTLDQRPPPWDQGGHLRYTFHYWQALTSGSENWWVDVLNVEPFYPPFFHLFLIPFSLLFGFALDTGIIANSLYLTIAILSTYGIGKLLFNRSTGLLAGFLISCYPFIVNMSREYLISIMLTCMVTLAYFLFLKSKFFEDKTFTFFFSIAFASGLMVKWTFLIYILPAILAGLLHGSLSLQKRLLQCLYYAGMILGLLVFPLFIYILGEIRIIVLFVELILIGTLVRTYSIELISPQKLLNLIALSCISVLICFPWYAHNLVNISIGMSKFAFPAEVLKGSMDWNLPSWGFYLEIIERQMGMPLFSLFIFACFSVLIKRNGSSLIILAWAFLPIIIFTFINNKGSRYTMPALPAMALISSLALTQIQSYPWRKSLYALTGIFALTTSFYVGFSKENISLPIIGGQLFGYKNTPITKSWPIDTVLDDILIEAKLSPGEFLTVRTLTNHFLFQRGGFRDSAEIRGLPIIMKSVKRNVGEMTDFFITKTGDYSSPTYRDINPKLTRLLKNPALTKTFIPFKTYPLPDGSQGLVLKKAIQPANALTGIKNLDQIGSLILTALESYPIYGIKNAVNPEISVIPTASPEDIFLGRYKQIKITADSAVSNKIILTDFELIFDDVQINIYDLILNNKFILFELGKLTPKGTLSFDALEKLAYKAMREKGTVKIEGSDNGLMLHATYNLPQGQTIEGSAKIKLLFTPGERIKPVVEFIKLGPLDIPSIFFRRITDANIVLTPTPGWPLETNIHTLRILPRELQINPTDD